MRTIEFITYGYRPGKRPIYAGTITKQAGRTLMLKKRYFPDVEKVTVFKLNSKVRPK